MVPPERTTEQRNILINITEGAVYISSAAFISPQTVIPAIVARLGGTNVEIGAIGVLTYVGAFIPQLFAARYVETLPWKKPWSIRFGAAQRFHVLFMGLVLLLSWWSQSWWVLWLFLLTFLMNNVVAGIATPGWFDLFAKLTSSKKRGRLVGIRNSLGGLGAFFGGVILTWLLARFGFPVNYAIGFFIAFALQFTSIVIQSRLVESEPSPVVARRPMRTYLRDLPVALRADKEFSRFLVACSFLVIAAMPAGFFTVYVLKDFQADESVVGQYTLAILAVQVVSSLVIGFITDRYGNKLALIATSVALLLASLWALIAPSPAWFTLVFVFLGVNLGAEMMVRFNMAIEYCRPEQRSTYIGLMSFLLTPWYLSGLAGGLISDAIGYKGVFALGILASVVGLYLLVKRVRDPRELAV